MLGNGRHCLIVLEIAGGLGHLAQIVPVARALKRQGAKVSLLTVQADLAKPYGPNGNEAIFERVMGLKWPGESKPAFMVQASLKVANTYPAILRRNSFRDQPTLLNRLQYLFQSFEVIAPDLLLAQHAPTAQLAAHLKGLKQASFGDGYCVPLVPGVDGKMASFLPEGLMVPRSNEGSFFPAFMQNDVDKDYETLESTIASVCTKLNLSISPRVAQWIDHEKQFLCTWPFFDHYGSREQAYYYGPHIEALGKGRLSWPKGSSVSSPKVLVYLSHQHPLLQPYLDQLEALNWPSVLYTNTPSGQYRLPGNVARGNEAIDIAWHLEQSDIVINHSSFGTCTQAMRAGKPIVAAPTNPEQMMLTRELTKLGVGTWGDPQHMALDEVLHSAASDAMSTQARALSKVIETVDLEGALLELTEDILEF
jgi:hypothetical protein